MTTDAEIIEAMARAMFDAVAEREKSLVRWDAAGNDERLFALFCARVAHAVCAPAIRAQAMEEAGITKLAAARKAQVDAVAAYNSRREALILLHGSTMGGVHDEFRAMEDAKSNFIRTAQEVADAALAPPAVAEKGSK